MRALLVCALSLALLSASRADEALVYVSCSASKEIEVYRIGEGGKLAPLSRQSLPGGPAPLALSLDKERIYAATQRKHEGKALVEIVTLRRKPQGKLQIEGSEAISERPAYLCVAPGGRHLLAAHYGGGFTTVFPIGEDGRFQAKPTDRAHTRRTAHCVAFDRSGRFVFIPHTEPNRIYQYRFDAKRGELVPSDPPSVSGPDEEGVRGPRHLRFHPTLPLAYSANELGGGISAWRLGEKGTLQLEQTLPTLPKNFKGESAGAEVRITPDGRFAYVSNRDRAKSAEGQDTLAMFAIDAQGTLSPLGHVPTARFPRTFSLDPQGRYLYAAGQRDARLAAYRVLPSGKLEEIERREVGGRPSWVLID